MRRIRNSLSITALALVVSVPAFAARCDTDVVPAATLLFPWFELDLAEPNGRTTLFAITNHSAEPTLANVVLWTDFAIPTFSFEVYLAGWDIQTINLRDVLVHGRLPSTGSAVSPHGPVSAEPVAFAGCNATTTQGDPPVYADPAIAPALLAELRAFHTGACSPSGLRAGSRRPQDGDDQLAHGYVTVDVVNRCSGLTPAADGYFVAGGLGVAGVRNVLTGDYFLVDRDEAFAQGEPAVHVEAFPGEFEPGEHTFYESNVGTSAADDREPLGFTYSIRVLATRDGLFDPGTNFLVWRDTGRPSQEPFQCFGGEGGGLKLWSDRVYLNETGDVTVDNDDSLGLITYVAFPYATQKDGPLDSDRPFFDFEPFEYGMMIYQDQRGAQPQYLQSWVSATHSAGGQFSVGTRANRLDSACDPESRFELPQPAEESTTE